MYIILHNSLELCSCLCFNYHNEEHFACVSFLETYLCSCVASGVGGTDKTGWIDVPTQILC